MARPITVSVATAPALEAGLDLGPILRTAMDEAMRIPKEKAQQNLSGRMARRRSGTLANSLTTLVVQAGNDIAGFLRTPVFYGRFLETGTVAHPIQGRVVRRRGRNGARRRILKLGPDVYRRAVHPEGVRSRRWMETAAFEADPLMEAVLSRHVAAAAAAFQARLEKG